MKPTNMSSRGSSYAFFFMSLPPLWFPTKYLQLVSNYVVPPSPRSWFCRRRCVVKPRLNCEEGAFGGRCVLYGTVAYNGTAQTLVLDGTSSPSLCYFVSVVSVCVAIYCFSITIYWVYLSCVGDEVTRARIWMTVSLVVCGIFLFFLLVSGCVLKIGRDHLCESIIAKTSLKSCEEAQNKTWVSPPKQVQFYFGLRNAETSVWVNFFFWIIIVAMVIIQKCQGSELLETPGNNAGGSSSETEPILPRPGKPQ